MIPLRASRQRIEQLADALEGRRPLDDAPAEVRGMVALATRVVDEVPSPTMSAEARDRVRDRVLADIHLERVATEAPARVTRSPRAMVATGLASALVAAGGVTVAAQEALPGDALYGLKKATESVRMAVAADPLEMSRLELTLARERLDEVVSANARATVRPSAMIATLREMDARSIAGIDGLLRAAERHDQPELLREAAAFTDQQFTELAAIFRELPVTVRPHAEDSLAVLRALRLERIDPALDGCTTCTEVVSASATPGPEAAPLISPLPHDSTVSERSSPEDGGDVAGTTTTSDELSEPLIERTEDEPLLERFRQERNTNTGLVPELPGPLDDLGSTVNDGVGSLLDGASSLLDDPAGALDSTVEELEGGVDGLLGGS